MLTITREFASACTKQDLQSMLCRLFNELANQTLTRAEQQSVHASIRAIRTELSHPAR
jgi:hypothetical protein